MSILSQPIFHDEAGGLRFLEARRLAGWPDLPALRRRRAHRKMGGKSTRIGAYKCYQCRKPFTVKVGTVFEASHVPLHKWLQAIYLWRPARRASARTSSTARWRSATRPRGSWRTASARRCAMATLAPLGGEAGIVEADETYIGTIAVKPHGEKKRPRLRATR